MSLFRFVAEDVAPILIVHDEDEREDKWEMYKTSFSQVRFCSTIVSLTH